MKVSLHTSPIAAIAHEAIVLPWLREVARTAATTRRTTAVLVPLRADAYFLKGRALEEGIGLFGVHFLTPGELRDRLIAHLDPELRVPSREHLRLLLTAAAELSGEAGGSALAGSPDQLLKAVDLIGSGGWDFETSGPAGLRPIVREFRHLLAGAGFTPVHEVDRIFRRRAREAEPLFARLLVTNFNALHWSLWPLLESAVWSAEEAVVCLTDPRTEGESLDAAWIGTWEETFGASSPVPDEGESFLLSDSLQLPESTAEIEARKAAPIREVEFLVGHDTAEQARAVAAQALRFVADPSCQRLGILFPTAGALARQVSALLDELKVSHNDGLAHFAPGPLEDAQWPVWLALQENPRLPALRRFLRTRPEQKFGGLSIATVENEFSRIFSDLLFDDLGLVTTWLEEHPQRRHALELAAALRELKWLPSQATLPEFETRTEAIFRELGWEARIDELRAISRSWPRPARFTISRRAWLRWLDDTLVSWRAERAESGRHPYSRVHLLPYPQAESQEWTHLVVAGLNEGQWPPAFEDSGFLGEEEIDALNGRLRGLNAQATAQGRQGEGHIIVQDGHALCLGPAQRRDLTARQFFNILESVRTALAVSAQLSDEAAPDRRLNPSDFLNRLYFSTQGRAASTGTMTSLRAETAQWLNRSGLWNPAPADAAIGKTTRHAYNARRDGSQPFGEFEFSRRSAPSEPVRLSATEWERAITSPALVFLGRMLGAENREEETETPWQLATGVWVHRWLRVLAKGVEAPAFAEVRPAAEWLKDVSAEAATFRDHVQALLRSQNRALPDWWLSVWQEARQIAERLARQVGGVTGRTHLATEWKLEGTTIPLPDGSQLRVHGRIDLILAADASEGRLPDDAWIVDFKTGNRKPLTVKKVRAADGLQLALYALALQTQGSSAVGISLLTPTLALDTPQLALPELLAETRFWQGLARLQTTGIFGQRGLLRDEFSFRSAYPLATLAIDPEVLEEKWALTHPTLGGEEESA